MGEFLLERAKEFFEEGEDLLKNKKKYNLAVHHFEQAAQLYIKFYIFKKVGDFTKTHSILILLEELGKAYEKPEVIKKFSDEFHIVLSNLEAAYLISRYMPRTYHQQEAEDIFDITSRLIKFLENDFS